MSVKEQSIENHPMKEINLDENNESNEANKN